MAVAGKLVLLSVIVSVLSLRLISAVKMNFQPQDISSKLVRREGSEITTDRNSSDRWQDPASEKTQVVLGSDARALLSRRSQYEAKHKGTPCLQNVIYDQCGKKSGNGYADGTGWTLQGCQNNCAGGTWGAFTFNPAKGFCKCCKLAVMTSTSVAGFEVTIGSTDCFVLDLAEECANKLRCWAEVQASIPAEEWLDFQTQCILAMTLDEIDADYCALWIECLSDFTHHLSFMAESAEVFAHLQLPFSVTSAPSLLLQQSNERQVAVIQDLPGCIYPDTVNVETLNCSCWDELREACVDQQYLHGNALRECYRTLMCASEDICHSWKTPNGYCTDAEIGGSTSLLAVQGIRKPERAVLADIFEGRRQPPENVSELGAAALEGSLSTKPCTESVR